MAADGYRYVGASQLKELSKRTTFIRCTQQLNPAFNSARHHNVEKMFKRPAGAGEGAGAGAQPSAPKRPRK